MIYPLLVGSTENCPIVVELTCLILYADRKENHTTLWHISLVVDGNDDDDGDGVLFFA